MKVRVNGITLQALATQTTSLHRDFEIEEAITSAHKECSKVFIHFAPYKLGVNSALRQKPFQLLVMSPVFFFFFIAIKQYNLPIMCELLF